MMNRHTWNKVYLMVRNGYNRIVGKDKLIAQYYDICQGLWGLSDALPNNAPAKKVIKDEMELICEEKIVQTGYGSGFYLKSINPYAMRTSPWELKGKIDQLTALNKRVLAMLPDQVRIH